jgi:hypothetical protein
MSLRTRLSLCRSVVSLHRKYLLSPLCRAPHVQFVIAPSALSSRKTVRQREVLCLSCARLPRLSSSGKASAVTGAYISLAGLCVLVWPRDVLLLLFSTSAVAVLGEGWSRLLALLAITFGAYYTGCAMLEWNGEPPPVAFYRSTVGGRLALGCSLCILVASGALPEPGVALLGLVNALGAAVMHVALQRDRDAHGSHWPSQPGM